MQFSKWEKFSICAVYFLTVTLVFPFIAGETRRRAAPENGEMWLVFVACALVAIFIATLFKGDSLALFFGVCIVGQATIALFLNKVMPIAYEMSLNVSGIIMYIGLACVILNFISRSHKIELNVG